MKLYWRIFILLFEKFILRRSSGRVVKKFATKMGVAYIKLAQILATQNFGNFFTENDRVELAEICDSCNPIGFRIDAEIRSFC